MHTSKVEKNQISWTGLSFVNLGCSLALWDPNSISLFLGMGSLGWTLQNSYWFHTLPNPFLFFSHIILRNIPFSQPPKCFAVFAICWSLKFIDCQVPDKDDRFRDRLRKIQVSYTSLSDFSRKRLLLPCKVDDVKDMIKTSHKSGMDELQGAVSRSEEAADHLLYRLLAMQWRAVQWTGTQHFDKTPGCRTSEIEYFNPQIIPSLHKTLKHRDVDS